MQKIDDFEEQAGGFRVCLFVEQSGGASANNNEQQQHLSFLIELWCKLNPFDRPWRLRR
jgi:hypothetical protein